MNARGLLDADMRTVGQWFGQAGRWWVDELKGFVPSRWRGVGGDAVPRLVFADGDLIPENGGAAFRLRPGLRATIIVPRTFCLCRRVERPRLNERDLHHMLTLESDTLLPFSADTVLAAGRATGTAAEPGRMTIEIAGLPIERARGIAAVITGAGVVAVRIIMQEPRGTLAPIDFAPAMREAGLILPLRSAATLVWALVGFLAALNLAALIWQDTARVARLEQLVADQQPAMTVAQTIARRTTGDQALVTRSVWLRRGHDALGGLARIGAVLPAGAWLQRYVWDGTTVRLTGYRPAKTDVASALRRSGGFAEVRSMTDETQAAVPAGEPFDLSARMPPS